MNINPEGKKKEEKQGLQHIGHMIGPQQMGTYMRAKEVNKNLKTNEIYKVIKYYHIKGIFNNITV